MRKSLFTAALLLAVLPLFGEIIKEWNFDNGKQPGVYYSRIIQFQKLEEKAPDGSSTARFTLTADTIGKKPWAAELNFVMDRKVVTGTRYRTVFYAKSDTKTTFLCNAQLNGSPWTGLGSGKKIHLTEQWQKITLEFSAGFDKEAAVRMLNFRFGNLPKGTALTLGKVIVEETQAFLPAALLKPQWIYFPKPDLGKINLNAYTEVPAELGGVKGIPVTAVNGKLDLSKIIRPSKEKEVGILMQILDAGKDGIIQIGCSADYWFDFMVNGKSAYDTLKSGNGGTDYKPEDHIFNFPVKKGKNLIVVKVLCGSSGWIFVYGPVTYKRKLQKITTIVRNKEWHPVKMGNPVWNSKTLYHPRIDEFKVIPGSALDLSQYVTHYDIDKMGRLKADKTGHLCFENAPGIPVRLRGFNCTYGNWIDRFCFFSKKEIEELAEELRLHGINVLRFHIWDDKFVGRNGFYTQSNRPRKTIDEVPIPQKLSELPIDKEFLDRYFYFVKCLRDRGIYMMIDIFTSSHMMTTAVKYGKGFPKFELFFNPIYRNHFKAAAEFWLKTVNPYTGKRLVDDPQLIAITFFNEQDMAFRNTILPRFTPYWRKAINDPKAPEFTFNLLRSDTETGKKARKFLLAAIDDLNGFYTKTVRDLGFKGFVTNWDMFVRNLEGYGRRNFDAVAKHTYHAHPRQAAAPANYKQRLSYAKWRKGVYIVNQDTSINKNSYIGPLSNSRVLGKPFLVTEYSHMPYNKFSSEAAVVWPAYASLQDWQMLAPHANTVVLHYNHLNGFSCDSTLNINGRVNFLCCAFGWQRGDIKSAQHAVSFHVPEKVMEGPNCMGSIGADHNNLFMLTRIGCDYLNKNNPLATLNFEPESYVGALDMGMWATVEEKKNASLRLLNEQISELRKAGILTKENRTDPNTGIFQSETGEIIADLKHHTLTVDAPKFQAAAVKPGVKIDLSQLEVHNVTTPCSVIAIALDKAESVSKSRHLLIIVNTMYVAENVVFSSPNFEMELDIGDLQVLAKTGKFDFSVKSEVAGIPKFYALNLNGSRECEIPLKKADDKLKFSLNTALLKYGTPYFELVY